MSLIGKFFGMNVNSYLVFLSLYISCGSSDTMSYNSESHGEEEIALVAMGLESASQNQVRARFRNSSDLIHHLFVCISGNYLCLDIYFTNNICMSIYILCVFVFSAKGSVNKL